jgi:hypothetical protein
VTTRAGASRSIRETNRDPQYDTQWGRVEIDTQFMESLPVAR